MRGFTISLDSEVINGYVGVWATINEKSHDNYGVMYKLINSYGEITVKDKEQLRAALIEADTVVAHNWDYDGVIINKILEDMMNPTRIEDLKKLNDIIFDKEKRQEVNIIKASSLKSLREIGVNMTDTLKILSNNGKGAFISLKTLQNAFGLKVDKHEFTEETVATPEFLDYFENDVVSLRNIWNMHWQFASTYENRKVALELLGIEVTKELLYSTNSHFLDTVFRLDTRSKANNINMTEEIPYTEAPMFYDHVKKINENMEGIRSGNLSPQEKKTLGTSVMWKNNKIDYSMGGIHSIHEIEKLFLAGDTHTILHIDVASLYPSIMLAHKDKFPNMNMTLYEDIKNRRLEYKANGDKKKSDAFKLLLNSSYGVINSIMDLKICDKDAGVFICLEGHRLLLEMVMELDRIDFELIQMNTDGIFIKVLNKDVKYVHQAISEWEAASGMTMESETYDLIFQENVNNYIAIESDGKVHRKGKFSKNYKSYHNLACPRTVRDLVVKLLQDDNNFRDLQITGIFNPKDGKNYYLTYRRTGIKFLTPKGNISKIAGFQDYHLTEDITQSDMDCYIKYANHILDEESLKLDVSAAKKERDIKKGRDLYNHCDNKTHRMNLDHATARKHHVTLGFEPTMTRTQYRRYLDEEENR